MFEQSSYVKETVATPLQAGDLFYNYEIKTWNRSPRLYKILGAAALANIAALFIFAQTSILTMKGCDSPFVGNVCKVLDTLYLGTKLFGTEREYVDAAYDKTELGDSEITFVDVSGETPPLSYPEGYFQVANPVEYAMQQQMLNDPALNNGFSNLPSGFPVTTPSTGSSLIDTAPNLPKQNPNVVDGELPTFGGGSGVASNPRPKTGNRGGRTKSPVTDNSVDDNDVAEVKPSPSPTESPAVAPTPLSSDAVKAVEINKKPLVDFADIVAAKWAAKELDLNQDFTVVLNGVLTADGKLDREKSKFDPNLEKGDPKMINVGKAAMEALGDSGYLTYLKLLGVDKVTATLVQDDEKINVVIKSSQKTADGATRIKNGINGYLLIGKTLVDNPSDERTLLDGASVTTDGKSFLLNFTMPKQIAQEMINRKLKEAQAKKALQPQPSSTSMLKQNGNVARR